MTAAHPAFGDVCGAVLAGGASRRMGTDKATLEVGGRPMAGRVVAALRDAGCHPVVAVGGDRRLGDVLDVEVVADRWPGSGPLGGIITALEHAGGAPVIVAACDLPWISGAVIGELLGASRAAAATGQPGAVDGPWQVVVARTVRLEPLCALWLPSAHAQLTAAFEAGERAVHVAMGHLRVLQCAVDPQALRNVNTPGDLELARRAESTASARPGGSVPA